MNTKWRLPDGKSFEFWDNKTKYKRTFHVAQQNSFSDDQNDGSKDKPFRTIGRAAEIAGPGDLVLIHEGEYHEVIRPRRGGNSDREMLCFQGVDREKVTVTGAETYDGEYSVSEGWMPNHPDGEHNRFADVGARVYMLRLPRNAFDGVNPFAMVNGPVTPWFFSGQSSIFVSGHSTLFDLPKEDDAQKKTVMKHRGMVFCDGRRLEQVVNYFELGSLPGSFYVEDDGLTMHLRMADDSHPGNHIIEYTAREQTFCPEEKYTGYISIENICFAKAGNGFPPPQRGSVSTNCGHHYMIDNCIVEWANGIGIDIGYQAPFRLSDAPRGYHQVKNCIIRGCGICGIAGVCGSTSTTPYLDMQQPSIFVTGNQLYDNCWQYIPSIYEEAAIKIHHAKDTLCTNNFISNTQFGYGIWMDASNANSAVRNNVMIGTGYSGVFFEASHDRLEVSYNIVVNVGRDADSFHGSGLLSFCCDEINYRRNIILGCCEYGINNILRPDRINVGRGNTGFGIHFHENIISDCRYALMQPKDRNNADGNLYGRFEEGGYLKVAFPELHLDFSAWQRYMGWDVKGASAEIEYELTQGDDQCLYIRILLNEKQVDAHIDLRASVEEQIEHLFAQIVQNGITG